MMEAARYPDDEKAQQQKEASLDSGDVADQHKDFDNVANGGKRDSHLKSDDDAFYDWTHLEGDEHHVVAEMNSGTNSEHKDVEKLPSKLYERMMKNRCCAFCLKRFPRTCAVWFGVVLPLWLLIIFSLWFGALMCNYEGPPEIDENNMKLSQTFFANISTSAVINFTMVLPRVCFTLYLVQGQNYTGDEPVSIAGLETNVTDMISPFLLNMKSKYGVAPLDSLLVPDQGNNYPNEAPELFEPDGVNINVTDFYYFMSSCGESGKAIAVKLLALTIENAIQASESLTFNWIRCFEGANHGDSGFNSQDLSPQQRSASGQTEVFTSAWEEDRQQLYEQYFNQSINEGVNPVVAHVNATIDAALNATGKSVCEWNSPAAAWFWFTVQTTVGYGNAPPTTYQSRDMIYTLGFIAILAFGGILATAGYILSFLFDHYAGNYGMGYLAKPWVACLIWGSVYYLWMVVIAVVTIQWKKDRLGEQFSMKDSYWFSYISTTSVGLGDFYLEPEGIINVDLIIFPLLFLVGFMYLSAFLGKLAELILSFVQKHRKSFIETLLDYQVGWLETFAQQETKEPSS
ncbi:hypothetical protein ACA910_015194 [Epithemia clementina (nom. ined.)]